MISKAFFSRAVALGGFASGESLADNQKAEVRNFADCISPKKFTCKKQVKAPLSERRAQYTIKRKR